MADMIAKNSKLILWKFTNLQCPCTIKSPSFQYLGAKLRLKFIYATSQSTRAAFVIVQRIENGLEMGLKIRCAIVRDLTDPPSYAQTLSIDNSSFEEYVIWMLEDQGHPINFSIEKSFGSNFCCIINLEPRMSDMANAKSDNLEPANFSFKFTSLSQDFGNLFNNPMMSDVVLACGSEKLYAHKIILAARSKYFDAMFRGDFKEGKGNSVKIEDTEPAVLKQVIKYLYCDNLPDLNSENAFKVCMAADKFLVDSLLVKCISFLAQEGQSVVSGVEATAASVIKARAASGVKARAASGVEAAKIVKTELSVSSYFKLINNLFETKAWGQLSDCKPELAQSALKFFIHQSSGTSS